jgi:hypothetical protein
MLKKAAMLLFLLSTGISGQIAPYYATLFNGSGATVYDRLLALTLAGIVNRDSARLYLVDVYETWSFNQTDEMWRDI